MSANFALTFMEKGITLYFSLKRISYCKEEKEKGVSNRGRETRKFINQ